MLSCEIFYNIMQISEGAFTSRGTLQMRHGNLRDTMSHLHAHVHATCGRVSHLPCIQHGRCHQVFHLRACVRRSCGHMSHFICMCMHKCDMVSCEIPCRILGACACTNATCHTMVYYMYRIICKMQRKYNILKSAKISNGHFERSNSDFKRPFRQSETAIIYPAFQDSTSAS